MKRIGHLFERVIEPENLRLAFLKASRGKRHTADQRQFQANLDEELIRLRRGLIDGSYPIGSYRRFMIHDPKEREICAADFGERVLHHALMNVCEPYFDRWLVDNTFASRKGKGQLAAIAKAHAYARQYTWFMKCDFRKYFDSIPHEGILRLLARKFKDPHVMGWFERILLAYEKTPGRGLPIGNLTSQHFANLYLDSLDRLEGRPSSAYVRYMDDFIFWSSKKEELKRFRHELGRFVETDLSRRFGGNARTFSRILRGKVQMQITTFNVTHGDLAAQEELNAFLRGRRVLQVNKAFTGNGWSFCVEWLDGKPSEGAAKWRERIDYREKLDPETFQRFVQLRERRKAIASEDGVPPYMIMTDAQMAEAAKATVLTEDALKGIEGFGIARLQKYGARLMAEMGTQSNKENENELQVQV